MNALSDSGAHTADNFFKLGARHDGLRLSEPLGSERSYAFRGLEDGVVDLEAVVLAGLLVMGAGALET